MFKILLFLICLTTSASAEVYEQPLTPEQKKQVEKIEAYFNSIHTLKSKFYQTGNNGGSAEGDLYILKPNKMNLQYRPPHPIEVIADGYYLIFHDKKLEQVTYLDLDENPASMILKENFSFQKEDLAITDMDIEPGIITITVTKKSQPSVGKITLIFKDKPLALKQWRVTDAQQITTFVTLDNIETNIAIDETLFKFKDPRKKRRPGDIPSRR